MTYILGISAYYHDSAATLIKNDKIINAVQEERFTRIKHDSSFPLKSIEFILRNNNLTMNDINYFVFYEKPLLKFKRLLKNYTLNAPLGFQSYITAMPLWLKRKIFQKYLIINALKKIDRNFNKKKLKFVGHHESHAASAFYPSPFKTSIILTIDGVGESATTTVSIGDRNNIKVVYSLHFPHSLGLLYSAFTQYLGFKVNSGEYKVMGLAPYGNAKFVDVIKKNLINIKNDGSFFLNQKYFNYSYGLNMINKNFENLFKMPKRNAEMKLDQFHMDIAASIQKITEEIVIKISEFAKEKFKIDNLCLAGGVALNCVANGEILKRKKYKKIWIQPAAGDAGGSLGAAYYYWHKVLNNPKNNNKDIMNGSFLGPEYEVEKIESDLNKLNSNFKLYEESSMLNLISDEIISGKVIGWFQGKMEFGPRALGARSIIADPRNQNMQKNLNLKIKYRESFRPFAPSILYEDLQEWFELDTDSDYMLFVSKIKNNHIIEGNNDKLFGIEKLNKIRSNVPAITHVDFSARIQTVKKDYNLKYYKLIQTFKEKTNCPILVNTSFNVRGEPIVCTIDDAYKCFMGTNMDILVIENFVLYKEHQNIENVKNYKYKYKLD